MVLEEEVADALSHYKNLVNIEIETISNCYLEQKRSASYKSRSVNSTHTVSEIKDQDGEHEEKKNMSDWTYYSDAADVKESLLQEEETILTTDCHTNEDKNDRTLIDTQSGARSSLVSMGADTTYGLSWLKLTSEQIAILMAIYFTSLITWLNLSIPAPFFPKEANRKGVNATISGWIFGVYALVQFIISPFYRRLLSKFSSKSLLLTGLLVCGGCTISFGLLGLIDTSNSIVVFVLLCFLIRMLLAVACTVLSNTGLVLLVQNFPNDVATLFGVGEVFTGVGLVAGPALGGYLYRTGGYILPFAALGSIAILALPFYWIFVPDIQNEAPTNEDMDLSMLRLLLHPKSIVNSIVIILLAVAWTVLDPTLEPHLREHNIDTDVVGIMFLVMAAFYCTTSPIWGRIADKVPENRVLIIIGLILVAFGSLWLGPSPLLRLSLKYDFVWHTAVSLGIIGTAYGMCVVPTYSVYISVLREIKYPQNNTPHGMVSGLFLSMYALGNFIGPSVGGHLFDQIGFEWLVTYLALACLLTSILVSVSLIAERKCS